MAFLADKDNKYLTKDFMLDMVATEKETKFNTRIADLAIALGVHGSWRDSMIKNGAQFGTASNGELIDKPFAELIPELIKGATDERLKYAQNISNSWGIDYDEPHQGRSI
jgi:hypothetical protein